MSAPWVISEYHLLTWGVTELPADLQNTLKASQIPSGSRSLQGQTTLTSPLFLWGGVTDDRWSVHEWVGTAPSDHSLPAHLRTHSSECDLLYALGWWHAGIGPWSPQTSGLDPTIQIQHENWSPQLSVSRSNCLPAPSTNWTTFKKPRSPGQDIPPQEKWVKDPHSLIWRPLFLHACSTKRFSEPSIYGKRSYWVYLFQNVNSLRYHSSHCGQIMLEAISKLWGF